MKLLFLFGTMWSFYRGYIEFSNHDLGWTVFWMVIFFCNLYGLTEK